MPFGTGMGGGIFYNEKIYEENGLSIPMTWEEFAANNDTLLAAGIRRVGASYAAGSTWTSQLFVLADFYNVAQAEPTFAEDYTANKVKYATTPAAVRGFEHLQEGFEKGWWNEDYGSATYEDVPEAGRRRDRALSDADVRGLGHRRVERGGRAGSGLLRPAR